MITLQCNEPLGVEASLLVGGGGARRGARGVHSLLYFAYTCSRPIYRGGGLFTLQKGL